MRNDRNTIVTNESNNLVIQQIQIQTNGSN